jgi:hypothetical protein
MIDRDFHGKVSLAPQRVANCRRGRIYDSMNAQALFGGVPERDYLGFGEGKNFNPKLLGDLLDLKPSDLRRVSPTTSGGTGKLRFEDLPEDVRVRMEEIAATCNLVATFFDGDVTKTALWFRTRNPMLGDVSPREMVRLGRFDRLRRFIVGAMSDWTPQRSLPIR